MSDDKQTCGVDMPRAGEGHYCPCEREPGHDGPHVHDGLAWPQGVNDPGAIFRP